MAVLGPEGVVTEVINYLSTNLGDKLVEVDARYTEQVVLEDVKEWRIDDPVQSGRYPDKTPVGWVICPEMVSMQWGSDYDYFEGDVVVWILMRDRNSAERLRRKAYRTALAVWEVLKDGHFSGSVIWQMVSTPPEMDFSEILSANDNSLVSDLRVRVHMEAQERA